MIRNIILLAFLSVIFLPRILGQTSQKRNWRDIADNSKTIIVGIIEKRSELFRPEKYKQKPDGSFPNDREFMVGELFQVKVTKTLKGEIRGEKGRNNEVLYIFTPGEQVYMPRETF